MYDEPFADASQIPTFLVSQMARRHVTVALSGDGGDEMFGGYARYAQARKLWDSASRVPASLRSLAGAALAPVASRTGRFDVTSQLLQQHTPLAAYELLVSQWNRPSRLVLGGTESAALKLSAARVPAGLGYVEQMMYLDSLNYLPDDIMVKVDRASMAVSLETRAPMLDHRVVELAWRLPFDAKVRGGVTKWVLKEIVYRHVPRELVDRPKSGFAVPLADWIRGPLRGVGARPHESGAPGAGRLLRSGRRESPPRSGRGGTGASGAPALGRPDVSGLAGCTSAHLDRRAQAYSDIL